MISSKSIYKFSIFPKVVLQAISTRAFGSIKDKNGFYENNINKFCQKLQINPENIVFGEQKHTGNVSLISSLESKIIPDTDGLMSYKDNIFLGIVTADCLPIFFFDKKKNIYGILHAGYKGLLGEIIENMIQKFVSLGSKADNIIVGMGPGIGVCCYNVSKDRVKLFSEKFKKFSDIFQVRKGQFFLDLNCVAWQILIDNGINLNNIEDSNICTKDNMDKFFSYRGESEETFGEFMSIIGLK